jgi:hypothetical protein
VACRAGCYALSTPRPAQHPSIPAAQQPHTRSPDGVAVQEVTPGDQAPHPSLHQQLPLAGAGCARWCWQGGAAAGGPEQAFRGGQGLKQAGCRLQCHKIGAGGTSQDAGACWQARGCDLENGGLRERRAQGLLESLVGWRKHCVCVLQK